MPQAVLALHRGLQRCGRPLLNAGVAIHSLRAAAPESIRQLVEGLGDVPIHIHVAEQTAEVDDCLQATGQRPIEWLARPCRLGRALAAGACHPQHARGDRRGGAQRRRRGDLPVHRRQPRRRLRRPAGLAAGRRADGHRLGQPRHARLAGRAALAGIRPAPAAPPAQRQRGAGRRRAGHRGAAVRPGPERRRHAPPASGAGG